MAKMRADIEKILIVSEEIASIKGRLDQIQSDLSNIKPANVLEGNTRKFIEEAITSAAGSVLSEAAHMHTMSEALALIAQTYQNTENEKDIYIIAGGATRQRRNAGAGGRLPAPSARGSALGQQLAIRLFWR